jgi:hypothetical protein
MSIDANTGVISGTPTNVMATTTYTVTQTKPDGSTVVYTFTITVDQTQTAYTIAGTITGLTSSGLVLQNNGGDNLTVAANSTTFSFATAMNSGATYSVTIQTQPTGQTCSVTNAGGTANANVSNVSLSCVTNSVAGTIAGLTSSGLVLQNNGGDNLTVAANSTTFSFTTAMNSGATYSVTIQTQPTGQFCTVTNGSGTISGAANVSISCVNTYTVGGSITGTVTGLVLQNNSGDDLTVPANGGSFTFATSFNSGSTYNVTIKTQPTAPAGASCTISNNTGTTGANVTGVTISCTCSTAAAYSWGTFNDRCNGIIEFVGTAGTFGGNVYEAKTLYYAKCSQGQTWNSTTNACDGTATSTIQFCNAQNDTCNGGSTAGSLLSGAAYTSCDALNTTPAGGFAGKTGWRTPTRNESKLTVLCTTPNNDITCATFTVPTVNTSLFPNTPSGNFWSREVRLLPMLGLYLLLTGLVM